MLWNIDAQIYRPANRVAYAMLLSNGELCIIRHMDEQLSFSTPDVCINPKRPNSRGVGGRGCVIEDLVNVCLRVADLVGSRGQYVARGYISQIDSDTVRGRVRRPLHACGRNASLDRDLLPSSY